MDHLPSGLTVAVHRQDRLLVPEDDGYLGNLCSGDVVLDVLLADPRFLAVFREDGRKRIIPQRTAFERLTTLRARCTGENGEPFRPRKGHELLLESLAREGERRFLYPVPIAAMKKTAMIYAKRFPDNCLKVVELTDRETGNVKVWELGIVSQEEQVFLTVQAFDNSCFRKERALAFPNVEKWWPELAVYLGTVLPSDVEPPSIETYRPRPALRVDDLRQNQGRVHRFRHAQDVGKIITHRGGVRVWWGDIREGRPRRKYLLRDEVVKIGRLGPPKTTIKGTSYELQAYDVELVAAATPSEAA